MQVQQTHGNACSHTFAQSQEAGAPMQSVRPVELHGLLCSTCICAAHACACSATHPGPSTAFLTPPCPSSQPPCRPSHPPRLSPHPPPPADTHALVSLCRSTRAPGCCASWAFLRASASSSRVSARALPAMNASSGSSSSSAGAPAAKSQANASHQEKTQTQSAVPPLLLLLLPRLCLRVCVC